MNIIFTSGQIVLLIIVTEFLIYSLLINISNLIKHCLTIRAYRKAMDRSDAHFMSLQEFQNGQLANNKEEEK